MYRSKSRSLASGCRIANCGRDSGLASKSHRRSYHSTLEKKKKKKQRGGRSLRLETNWPRVRLPRTWRGPLRWRGPLDPK